ncbi:MAG: hypothetical protein Nk1A_4100 [Endomicrobiia bacterium]|nr:MAG: hypothetical protein Nk1A_4100 [Endomicrobiia bacterium]
MREICIREVGNYFCTDSKINLKPLCLYTANFTDDKIENNYCLISVKNNEESKKYVTKVKRNINFTKIRII